MAHPRHTSADTVGRAVAVTLCVTLATHRPDVGWVCRPRATFPPAPTGPARAEAG
ncbi:MAG TPA: hypothetical protein VMD09_09295 [Solirubrobacteraceae bacterium]|nr:hypothetical protein [Solirubrobacteraceae bacterium]